MQTHEAVSIRIQQLVTEKGWTTNELVRRANINQTTISEIKAGRSKNPRFNTVAKIARGFGMSLPEFLDHEVFHDLDLDD
ncbi:helix-turn-helix domain-containing protein [Bhargavaea beijingensis]|uniref:helix-turn-helix domain-containing protein n=1 Tax=Bhargavaea beijingensis TaxID=426756 RepID=UPI002224D1AC|nr:helix-turn-helix transcriptional regulator [Bhargavaea beijingensis]MCW1929559.1 helix-turn-helix transcriptional regulator [Bhargavaea beijingensis]